MRKKRKKGKICMEPRAGLHSYRLPQIENEYKRKSATLLDVRSDQKSMVYHNEAAISHLTKPQI